MLVLTSDFYGKQNKTVRNYNELIINCYVANISVTAYYSESGKDDIDKARHAA